MPFSLPQWIAAAWMTGIIWQVQLLTYPQFMRVGEREFAAYHREHLRRMGWVVIPPMLAELGLAIAAWWMVRDLVTGVGLGFVAAIWATTGLIQVPLHRRLSHGRDEASIRKLVATNWIRTVLWTARLCLLLAWGV